MNNRQELGGILQYEATVYLVSYGGMFYDTFVGALLMFDTTFWLGIILTLIFHTSNKLIFNIGIFPYVMIASTSLFFKPDWPRKVYNYITRQPHTTVGNTDVKFSDYVPPVKRSLSVFKILMTIGVVIFLIWWVLMPIRFLYMPSDKGPQAWTENAHMVCTHFLTLPSNIT